VREHNERSTAWISGEPRTISVEYNEGDSITVPQYDGSVLHLCRPIRVRPDRPRQALEYVAITRKRRGRNRVALTSIPTRRPPRHSIP